MSSLKDSARQWVRDGVKSGRVVKPARCPKCGSTKNISHHHPRGYERYRDIEWLCRACHDAADVRDRRQLKHTY
jgi:hypothetical protein